MMDLYLVGGGGHCHSCIDVIELEKKYIIKGIFDKKENINKEILGYKIIGSDEDIPEYISLNSYFLITVGQIKSPKIRIKIFENLKKHNAQMATVVSPRAYVSKYSKIGEGSIILHDSLINSNVAVGMNCIVNTKALIEHDAIIENDCHISTAAVVNGNCHIEAGSFIGSNAVLKECIRVAARSIVPAGSFYRGK